MLDDQAGHRRELMVALARQVRMNAPNNGGQGSALNLLWRRMGDRYLDSLKPEELRELVASLPPARPAADALHAQRALLVAWCRKLPDLPERDSVAAMAAHLRTHIDRLHVHPEAPELVVRLKRLEYRVMRVVDRPANRMRVKVGRCPEVNCTGTVEAIVPHEAPPMIRCPSCQREWDSTQWTRLGARILRAA
jgi:hypothetical protein